MSYFNTTNLTGEHLKEAAEKCLSQDKRIMAFFAKKKKSYTPFEIQKVCLPNAPITSVRRSLTNLTSDGLLIKTIEKNIGNYGRPNYKWRAK
jgi:hypothetical protein